MAPMTRESGIGMAQNPYAMSCLTMWPAARCWTMFLVAVSLFLPHAARQAAAQFPPATLEAEWVGGPRWMGGNPIANGEAFFGSITRGSYTTIGSSLSDTAVIPVEIRFSDDTVSLCQVFDIGFSYQPVGVGTFPGSVWDISDASAPRRLNVCFAECDSCTGRYRLQISSGIRTRPGDPPAGGNGNSYM